MTRPVALVTGGAVRIGAAIVRSLASKGHDVVVHYRQSREEAFELTRSIERDFGVTGHVVQGDLSRPDVASLVDAAFDASGRSLDVLVNNASIFGKDDALSIDADSLDRHMAVNLRAPLLLAARFAATASRGSSVVNILDQRVLRTTPRYFSYTLSKCALRDATRTLAQDFGPRGIRVNAVAPGLTLMNDRQDENDFRKRIETLPLSTGGSAEEVGAAILFLLSSPSLTGQIIAVDGGQSLAWQTPDVSAA